MFSIKPVINIDMFYQDAKYFFMIAVMILIWWLSAQVLWAIFSLVPGKKGNAFHDYLTFRRALGIMLMVNALAWLYLNVVRMRG